MTNKLKKAHKYIWTKNKLIIWGVLLTFGWPILLAATKWIESLSCYFSPRSCTEGVDAASILLLPILVGAVMLAAGYMTDSPWPRQAKAITTLLMVGVLYCVGYWVLAFAGILFYGLQG